MARPGDLPATLAAAAAGCGCLTAVNQETASGRGLLGEAGGGGESAGAPPGVALEGVEALEID